MEAVIQKQTTESDDLQLDINKLIQLIIDVSSNEKTAKEAVQEFAKPYVDFAEVYTLNKAKEFINEKLNEAGLEDLSDTDFSEKLIDSAKGVASAVHRYIREGMTEEQFVNEIGNTGLQDVMTNVMSALGIHEKLGVNSVEDILKLAPPVLAVTASLAAYRELRKALDDLEIAKKRRKEIEAECEMSITMIRRYKAEMDRVVSDYLTDRLETFDMAMEVMENALMEMDSDGYLKGNAIIQEILGYKSQFTNQKEFDDLMDSNESFRL